MDRACILVIEDDVMLAELVKQALQLTAGEQGYTVEICCASDGIQGLEQIEKAQPDLLLLDVHMPRLDGYGVLQILRARGIRIPVIVMSGVPREEVKQEMLADHVIYLPKPFKPLLLSCQILDLLKRKQKDVLSQNRER